MNNHAYSHNLLADLFLRDFVAQLTQSISQFAIIPGEKEAKKRLEFLEEGFKWI